MKQAGAIPSQIIEQFIEGGQIRAAEPVPAGNVQPASLDLRLGPVAHRVKASFLPRTEETIQEALSAYVEETLDLTRGATLEVDQTYVIELAEELSLPPGVHAYTNNKSSTGRMNVWARTLVDRVPRYDKIPAGYRGKLYLMTTPRSWRLRVAAGTTLNQARFLRGENRLTDLELEMAHQQMHLVCDAQGRPVEPVIDSGLLLSVDLEQEVVGFEALPDPEKVVDLTRSTPHDGSLYFRPVRARGGEVLLEKDRFYILSTREFLRVPPLFAVEMVAYDIHSGEYRSHYAGFFDPGFGYGRQGEIRGTPAVLEVDTRERVIFRHGQPICKMVFEHL
ncbi:MAG TPA: 2'-deoxycytidine 5'-triphosphate deaminase, partial [Candidatus Nitrosotenuis sp.]|nr:2'-deoxycytidine 5'-triphosphate deaminase [Candidatus Nitrosotenuis sp.]